MYKICKVYYYKCLDTNRDINLAFLQICSTLIGAGFLNPTMMLLNRPIRGMLSQMNRDSIDVNNGKLHHKAL